MSITIRPGIVVAVIAGWLAAVAVPATALAFVPPSLVAHGAHQGVRGVAELGARNGQLDLQILRSACLGVPAGAGITPITLPGQPVALRSYACDVQFVDELANADHQLVDCMAEAGDNWLFQGVCGYLDSQLRQLILDEWIICTLIQN